MTRPLEVNDRVRVLPMGHIADKWHHRTGFIDLIYPRNPFTMLSSYGVTLEGDGEQLALVASEFVRIAQPTRVFTDKEFIKAWGTECTVAGVAAKLGIKH